MIPQVFLDLLALPPEASTAAPGIDALHLAVISVTMAASLLVGLVALYFIIRYRRAGEARPTTPRVEATRLTEGALIAGILALFLGFWAVGYRQYIAMQEPPEDALTIYVMAKQWMWKFAYPDGRKSNDVLVVPVHRPVRLVMTSRDVIHSFFVPAFRQKHDILPGRYVTTWFEATRPGVYPIRCAEYCGVSHSMMLGSVRVLSAEDYAAWTRLPTSDASGEPALAEVGARVALRRGCVVCHTVDGERHVGPTWSRLYEADVALSDGRVVRADEAYLTRAMMEPNAEIVAGYPLIMPSYFGILDATETAALVEYIKSVRDTEVPSGVQLPPLGVEIGAKAGVDGGPP